jgi:hypothetical protein
MTTDLGTGIEFVVQTDRLMGHGSSDAGQMKKWASRSQALSYD